MKAILFTLIGLFSFAAQAKLVQMPALVSCREAQASSTWYEIAIVKSGPESEDMLIVKHLGHSLPKLVFQDDIGDKTIRSGATDYFTFTDSSRLTVIRGKIILGRLSMNIESAREMDADPSSPDLICTANSTIFFEEKIRRY